MTEKYALLFYTIKIVSFSASTWISHIAAYHILEGLRLRLTDRFLKAPLGDVEGHSIGEIKSIMVEKIENMEPPIAHMIPEGSGHILLPVISFIALLTLDWRIARTSLVTVPLSLVFMTLTMIISGKSFTQYDESNAHMNSTIVEYIEGIEVIKAFGRVGTSYEKYAKANFINIFDQIKDEEKPRYYSEFQYYTCYEKDTINIEKYKKILYLDNQKYLYPVFLARIMSVDPSVFQRYCHFKFYMLMGHLKNTLCL